MRKFSYLSAIEVDVMNHSESAPGQGGVQAIPRVGVVMINYNNTRFTEQALESLAPSFDNEKGLVVVVDNNSQGDESARLRSLQAKCPWVHFLLLPENVGYFAGINRGLDFIATLDSSVQLVVVGNNDLKFPRDFFQQIVSNRDLWDSYAVVSPSIRTEDGTHQNPHSVGGISRGAWDPETPSATSVGSRA